jgi:MFS family permease
MEQMIVARVFQGLGFAGVLSSVWITTATMWAPKDRAKWLGVLSGAFTLSGVAGPILGGFFRTRSAGDGCSGSIFRWESQLCGTCCTSSPKLNVRSNLGT